MQQSITAVLIFILSFFFRIAHRNVPLPINLPQEATTSASPSASPTPRPLTFEELNQLYGPCVSVPTLMYHHVQNLKVATEQGHAGLTVAPETFRAHLQYLRDSGYTVISGAQLIAFFDQGTAVPSKSVLLTFDDGYDDFATTAAPLLKEFGYPAVVFIPTGLMENGGYMNWGQVTDLNNSGLYMANHTWSHRNVAGSPETIENEIATAQTQLTDHGLNSAKIFGYPYGFPSDHAVAYLAQNGYSVAFTTQPGSTLCKQQRFTLPRIRIGNSSLGTYGF